MELKRNLILQGTEAFSRGALDNVALENGGIVLDSSAGSYLQYGSYTTTEFAMPAFCSLNVSWNALAPKNTLVQVQCRVFTTGWSRWVSFGKWAPDYPRVSLPGQSEEGRVCLEGDTLLITLPAGATGAQLRVNLSSNDNKVTPELRRLAVAVCPVSWEKRVGHPLNRTLYLPTYLAAQHPLPFGREMGLPLVLTAQMNRFGEDILPEELAYTMLDLESGTTDNAAFAAAAAGSCGYASWQAWMDLEELRREIKDGCPVAVRMEEQLPGRPDPVRSWMGLYGFVYDEESRSTVAQLMDPLAADEATAQRQLPLEEFGRCFTGRAVVLHPKTKGVWGNRPDRVRCDLNRCPEEGEYLLSCRGEPTPLPEAFDGWLAYTRFDGIAHATTAHKTFCPMEQRPEGRLAFPPEAVAEGGRFAVYAVDRTGVMQVSELRLAPKPPAPPRTETEAAKESLT